MEWEPILLLLREQEKYFYWCLLSAEKSSRSCTSLGDVCWNSCPCRDFTSLPVEPQLCKALKWSIKADQLPGEWEEERGRREGLVQHKSAGDKCKLSPKLVFFISHGEFIIFQGLRAHKHTPGSWAAICVLKPLVGRFLCWNRQSCFTVIVHAVSSFLI